MDQPHCHSPYPNHPSEVMLLLRDATTVMPSRTLSLCSTRGDSEGSAKPWESIQKKSSTIPCSDTASAAKIQKLQQRCIIFIPGQIPIPPREQRHQNLDGCTFLCVPVPWVRAERGAAQSDPTRGTKALQVIPEPRKARSGLKSRRDDAGFQQSWHSPGKR